MHRRAQGADGLLDEGATPGVLLSRRQLGIPKGMMELAATHDAIGANARGYRIETGGQHSGNADTFTFFGDRSPATCARASGRRQHHGPHMALQ
jgi:hypothetical protein